MYRTQRKNTVSARSSNTDEVWVNTTVSTVLGGSRLRERTGASKDKLEKHSQERSTQIETHLGRGSGTGQTVMAS